MPESLEEYKRFVPDFTIVAVPGFKAAPAVDNTNSDTFIVLNFEKRLAIVGNTLYAGELKKSVFTLLNYLLPLQGVLSMHCSANVSPDDTDDVALFFGLSGTGKRRCGFVLRLDRDRQNDPFCRPDTPPHWG